MIQTDGNMTASKMSLLEQNFIGENVSITTTLKQTVSTPDGEFIEVPLIYEGIILDVDKDSVLMDLAPNGAVRLIMLDKVVDVEVMQEQKVQYDIPNKPNKRDMN